MGRSEQRSIRAEHERDLRNRTLVSVQFRSAVGLIFTVYLMINFNLKYQKMVMFDHESHNYDWIGGSLVISG